MGTTRITLTLYVARDSQRSLRAQRRWRALLEDYPSDSYDFAVRDLSFPVSHADADADAITKTPTMVIRGVVHARVIGDLAPEHVAGVLDVLATCGLARRGAAQ